MSRADGPEIEIASRDYWFKVVGMLGQSWALIDGAQGGRAAVHFVSDASGVFDGMAFDSAEAAAEALAHNGFRRLDGDPRAQAFLAPPGPPFRASSHPNGRIYSSGRFWMAPPAPHPGEE